jgi:hypothetical protein
MFRILIELWHLLVSLFLVKNKIEISRNRNFTIITELPAGEIEIKKKKKTFCTETLVFL